MAITFSGLTENQKKVLRKALLDSISESGLALHAEGIDAEERARIEQDMLDAHLLYMCEDLM